MAGDEGRTCTDASKVKLDLIDNFYGIVFFFNFLGVLSGFSGVGSGGGPLL